MKSPEWIGLLLWTLHQGSHASLRYGLMTDSHHCISCAEETMRLLIDQKSNCYHFAASNPFEFWSCELLRDWLSSKIFERRLVESSIDGLISATISYPSSPNMSHVSWSMKCLRPQSSSMIAFRMSNTPACPISPHGSFRESCHAMNSGPADTANATVAFCSPSLQGIQMLHICINVQNWHSTSPWRNLCNLQALVSSGLPKKQPSTWWVSASHFWQFCDLCLTTISWDRLQELLFRPRRTRIQLGLTTKCSRACNKGGTTSITHGVFG